MSSDLFVYDSSFFSDPFADSSHGFLTYEILEEIQENETAELAPELDQIASALLSSSPPSVQLQSLSLSQLACSGMDVKSEDFHLCPASDEAARFMQRSFSSNSFENKHGFSIAPPLGGVWEPQNQILESPKGSHMRRACSTGDLQNVKTTIQSGNVLSSSPLSANKSYMEEAASFKVGKYTAEERKGRIDRYRAKRTQRNFNKTIKYACRKTLADNRPRIRGRFARNDEAGDMPKPSMYQRFEDDDDLWINGLHEDDEEESAQKWAFFNGSSSSQYENYSY